MALLLAAVAIATACSPNLNDTTSFVTGPTVLAVQSIPAEAPPSTSVTYHALVVGPAGDLQSQPLQWSYCNYRNPLSNLEIVAPECVQPGNGALQQIGVGESAIAAIPMQACTTFGPNPPPATLQQPAGRPVDPDTTGGYYQPVSLFLSGANGLQVLVYEMRVSCGFSGANQAAQGTLDSRYHANENPMIASLTSKGSVLATDTMGETNSVTVGATVPLEVAWPSCPLADVCGDGICGADETTMTCPADCNQPKGCAGAERFVSFDLGSQSVLDEREAMQITWYATDGAFDDDSTGRTGTDTSVVSDNNWRAPSQPGTVHMWIVLHDARGGIGWAGYSFDVH
jgi:hypothetical protein